MSTRWHSRLARMALAGASVAVLASATQPRSEGLPSWNDTPAKQRLEWTAAGGGARFIGLVHHTDAEREFAYDRKSAVGRLDAALDEAAARRWTVVSMKGDGKAIFP